MSTECRMLRGSPPCCMSCHDQYEEGSDPIEIEVDGLVAQVCCRVACWLIAGRATGEGEGLK